MTDFITRHAAVRRIKMVGEMHGNLATELYDADTETKKIHRHVYDVSGNSEDKTSTCAETGHDRGI